MLWNLGWVVFSPKFSFSSTISSIKLLLQFYQNWAYLCGPIYFFILLHGSQACHGKGTCNSVKLWAMPCRASQDGRAIVESWQIAVKWRRDGRPPQASCLKNPMNSVKRQKDMTLEGERPRSEGVQYELREERRAVTRSSRKDEAAEPKWK